MLAKNCLLIVSNPKQIAKILPSVKKQVKETLYIQLLSALTEPLGNFHSNIFNSWPKYSQTISRIYAQAVKCCQDLDVRVLLSGLKYSNINLIKTSRSIDLVIFDKNHNKADIDKFVKHKIGSIAEQFDVITLDAGDFEAFENPENCNEKICEHTVLGGTFDRLHVAHKLLLSEAALRAKSKITVGVTEENMLQGKTLWELVQPLETRLVGVTDFLIDICPELEQNVVSISDPFGPAVIDPSMNLIVVSEETLKGGQKINDIRRSKNLNELEVIPVPLIDEPHPDANEESKISSSTTRMRLLGTLINPVIKKAISDSPYIIGLTGGVASGKSSVAKWLSLLGAEIIDCDKIAHQVYLPQTDCYHKLVATFGEKIIGDNNEINRKVLGSIVFGNREEMEKLNNLVWPCIAHEVNNIISNSASKVIIVEAAVLLMAGWENMCHEIWSTLIPRDEAILRLKLRNSLTDEQASARINSQPPNLTFVQRANVVFCTLWDVDYTKKQVKIAWDLLQKRIL